jgi:hypothetical protein
MSIQGVACDAVLEHVRNPAYWRPAATPPGDALLSSFHAYPNDSRRFSIEGLKELAGPMEVVAEGWRTGPTATLLVIVIEYMKLLLPFRAWRAFSHVLCGWVLFPLRYLDLLLFRSPESRRIGNHCYLWLRQPDR